MNASEIMHGFNNESLWSWYPSVIIGTVIVLVAYLLLFFRTTSPEKGGGKQITWFVLGIAVMFFSLVSPLDALGDEYWFSAHMVQHTLLAFIAPPLIVLGASGLVTETWTRHLWPRRVMRFLTSPLIAFTLFNLNMAAWHFPGLYEAALNNESLHILQHLLFLTTGVMNWWPVLSRSKALPAIGFPLQTLYLFLEMIPCTILGAIILFAPSVMYANYADAPRIFNLSPMDDQQIAGLVMVLPAGMIYMAAFAFRFYKWMESDSKKADQKAS